MQNGLNRNAFRREWKSVLFFSAAALVPTLWVILDPQTGLQASLGTILATILIGLVGWWFLRREGVRAEDIGFGRRNWKASALLFLAWWAVVSLIDWIAPSIAALFGAQLLPIEETTFSLQTVLDFVRAWVFVGFAEEIAFRGYLQNKLAVLINNRWAAAGLSAVLFGLWHIPGDIVETGSLTPGMLANLLVITVLSLLLFNFTYEWTGLLPFLALVHGWNDDLLMMSLRAPNPAGMVAGYALVFVFLWLYMKYWRKKAQPES